MKAIDHDEDDGRFWSAELDKITVGNYTKSQDDLIAVIDTGNAFTTLAETDYQMFMERLLSIGGNDPAFVCYSTFCHAKKSCDNYYDDMPVIEFNFKGMKEPITLEPWSYSFN